MAAHYVAFGSIEDMVAEVSAFLMPADWIAEYGFTHCVMVVGDEQYDTQYVSSIEEARALAKDEAESYGVEVQRV